MDSSASQAFRMVPLTPAETGLPQSVIRRAQGALNPHPAPQARPAGGAVRNIVFDFGGVLVNWDPFGPLSSRYSVDLIRDFRDNSRSGFDDANDSTDSGHDLESAIVIMSRHGALWGQMMDFYLHRFPQAIMGETPGARQLVFDLHAAGYKCWGLSNWSPQNFKDAWNVIPLFGELDGFIVSGFVHDMKPHASIFHLAERKFSFTAQSAVFVDDKPSNVTAARKVGWKGVVQTTPQDVRAGLIALGVRIPPVRERP